MYYISYSLLWRGGRLAPPTSAILAHLPRPPGRRGTLGRAALPTALPHSSITCCGRPAARFNTALTRYRGRGSTPQVARWMATAEDHTRRSGCGVECGGRAVRRRGHGAHRSLMAGVPAGRERAPRVVSINMPQDRSFPLVTASSWCPPGALAGPDRPRRPIQRLLTQVRKGVGRSDTLRKGGWGALSQLPAAPVRPPCDQGRVSAGRREPERPATVDSQREGTS